MSDEKPHLSIVISGHVDSGKSTTTGRLIFELGGIDAREMEKLKAEAETLGKGSFAFAFFMDTQAEERKRGVTIACNTKEFFTEKFHYTIIDAPGHRDFINNMISGASQADVALLLVPASGGFTAAICKEDRKAGIIQGQTRQHGLLLNLLGVTQLIVGVNKMDEKSVKYSQARFKEVASEMKDMLVKVGWKKDFIKKCTPVLPLSGWMGDNLTEGTTNMDWWKGQKVKDILGKEHLVKTLLDCLNNFVQQPDRKPDLAARVPISGVFSIKGVGAVLTGCVEQGTINPDAKVVFMPTHTTANPCKGTVFTIEMHHKKVKFAGAGDNVGMNIKGLKKENMPRKGDVMCLESDTTLNGKHVKNFTAQVQTLSVPKEIKVGYSPIGLVRTGRSACKLIKIEWKKGKSTKGQKVDNPPNLKSKEVAQLIFEPIQPLCVEPFKQCEGLGRIAFLDGNTAIMLGKIAKVEYK